MPEFYIIIARKIFFPEFWGACAPPYSRLLRLCLAVNNATVSVADPGFAKGGNMASARRAEREPKRRRSQQRGPGAEPLVGG